MVQDGGGRWHSQSAVSLLAAPGWADRCRTGPLHVVSYRIEPVSEPVRPRMTAQQGRHGVCRVGGRS